MHRFLRHPARTPHLRVMAWFAWLMLALTPVYGAPGGMASDGHGMSHGMSQTSLMIPMTDHAAHDMSAMTTDCCTGQAPHTHDAMSSCHCAATCASVLPVPAMLELAPAFMHAMSVPRHGAMAPSVTRSPPLRPPLLQTSRLT
jgi:hypothetical protein